MTRKVRFLSFAVAAALCGNTLPAQTREAEAVRVYSAAFDFLFGQYQGEFPGTIVLMDSTSWDAGAVAYKGVLKQPHSSAVDAETIIDFEARNRQRSHLVRSDFSYRLPIVLLNLPEYFRLDTLGRKILKKVPWSPDLQPGTLMDALAARFPRAWGISAVSRVGFNSAQTQAMVLVVNNCGTCYSSETLVFRKKARKWVLQERIPFRSQDGLGPGETRYLGVNARYLSLTRRTQDSTRRALADSLARAKRPRRIRGTITNRQTGRPIPFAQVLLFSPRPYGTRQDSIPRPDQRVVADRRGRYVISNPAVGGTMLAILCPGPVYFDRPSLGAPGVYVFPGTDTTFNFAAQDFSACWTRTRVHSLEPGWFESAEALNATVPDSAASNVLAVVIRNLQTAQPAEQIVGMFTRTITACRAARVCGSVQVPRLIHEGTLDSSTAIDFRKRSSKREIMRPGFAQSLGLRVITDAEFSYLSGEAGWPFGWPASDAQADSSRFWKAFRKLYGQHAAIVSVTRVGFNNSRTQALVEAKIDTAVGMWNSNPSRMLLLQKQNDAWVVINDNVGNGTISGKLEGSACVASSPPPGNISLEEIEKLDGMFELRIEAVGLNSFSETMLMRIGHNMPARWIQPPPGVTTAPPSRPHSFELLNLNGSVAADRTIETSMTGIPPNVLRDPNIIQLDGFYQNLNILSISDAGFSGSYVAGVFGDSDFGYFCARRTSAVEPGGK